MESETPFLNIFLLSALCLHCIPSMNSSPTLLGPCNFVGQICLSWTLRAGGAIGLLGLMKYFHSFELVQVWGYDLQSVSASEKPSNDTS